MAALLAVGVIGPVMGAGAKADGLPAPAGPVVPAQSTTTTPPPCRQADQTTRFASTADWSRSLVDWTLRLPASYRPPRLVPVSRAGLSGGGYVRAELIPDLRAMAAAARKAGAPLAVQSAYRSFATQRATFGWWASRLGLRSAVIGSARAGHSEHQLGTAIDFRSLRGGAPWSFRGFDWAKTRAGAWMARNAWRYGFVMSYPRGKQATVCYGYEPWHYRYYGRAVASAIHASGLAPRVWLWQHGNDPGAVDPTPTPSPSESAVPSDVPSAVPSDVPSESPSAEPSASPSADPSIAPTADPSASPSADPASAAPSPDGPAASLPAAETTPGASSAPPAP